MKRNRFLALVCLLLLATLAVAGCNKQTGGKQGGAQDNSIRVEEKPTLYVGFIGPLSGANQPQGQAAFDAFQMAVNKWMGSQEDLPYSLVVVEMDDQGDLEEAAARSQELVDFPETIVTCGFWTNGTAAEGIPVFQKAGVPLVIWGANGADLLSKDTYPTVSRVCPSLAQEAAVLAEKMFGKLEYKNVYIVVEENDQAVAQGEAFVQEASRWPLEQMHVKESFDPEKSADASELLIQIQEQGVDVVFYAGSAKGAGAFRQAMGHAGITDIPLCGTSVIAGKSFFTAAGDYAAGCLSLQAGVDLTATAKGQAFAADYQAGDYQFPLAPYTEYAYDAAQSIIRALESLEGVPTREAMTKALQDVQVKGVTGEFTFDDVGQATHATGQLLEAKDGVWQVK